MKWALLLAGLALAAGPAEVWRFDSLERIGGHAPKVEGQPRVVNGVTMDTYHRWMEVVIGATLAGCPAISVPVGFSASGLPMGLQIVGPHHADLAVLQLAHAYEQATNWVRDHPPSLIATG